MLYMISTSLRPNGALYEFPAAFLPQGGTMTLENYRYIIGQSKFYVNFLNSVSYRCLRRAGGARVLRHGLRHG
jgi:ABC-type glycerol-3-phosphate transport system permease component